MNRIFATVISTWLVTTAFADTHYVSLEGGNHPPYTTWQDAATQIQSAVDAATTGDQVLISNGTYLLTTQIVITNRASLIGLNGYSNTLIAVDWPAYTNRCIYVSGTSVIDGLSFSNGHILSSVTDDNGGGMWARGNPLIRNCWFGYNYCSNSVINTSQRGGAGLWISNGVVSNCVFESNQAYRGGGGICAYLNSTVRVTHSTIISNVCFSESLDCYGAGIWSGDGYLRCIVSNSLISANSFSGAASDYGGGASACYITHSTSTLNSAIYGGGGHNGIYSNSTLSFNTAFAGGGIAGSTAGIKIYRCDIHGNSASSRGGGVRFNLNTALQYLEYCTLSNNRASSGGAISFEVGGRLFNCMVNNNTNLSGSEFGGAIVVDNFSTSGTYTGSIENCTIVNNYSSNDCGGVYVVGSTNLIYNCVIAGNRSFSNQYTDVYATVGTHCFYNCLVGTNRLLLNPDQGNIYGDPKFKDPAGDYRLASDSACVNAGTNRSWTTNATDLAGSIRIRYGTVDIGAYEVVYQGLLFQTR